jgi:hypothetical protein
VKPQVCEQALRAIVAALLGSRLPADDIREAAELLTTDSDFARRFRTMIDAVLAQLPPPAARRHAAPSNGSSSSRAASSTNGNSVADEMLRILEPFRISNRELIEQMRSHPALAGWEPRPSWSRRKIIESVVERVSRAKLPEVLATVTVGRGPVDPWMEALAARGRKGHGRD